METSGVVSGGKIADYLSAGADKNAVLDQLLAGDSSADAAAAEATEEKTSAGADARIEAVLTEGEVNVSNIIID